MWYEFKAWNSATLYGYTDNPSIAEFYCGHLNRNREFNVYDYRPVTDAALIAELDRGTHAVFTQDTKLEDIIDEEATNHA